MSWIYDVEKITFKEVADGFQAWYFIFVPKSDFSLEISRPGQYLYKLIKVYIFIVLTNISRIYSNILLTIFTFSKYCCISNVWK